MYTGEFEGGFRHGTGVMLYVTCDPAAAVVFRLPNVDACDCVCVCRYRSKAKFTGQFVMDMFSGQGELNYADGSMYERSLSYVFPRCSTPLCL